MNWLYYLLEANLYLAAFYGFYRLLLHRETFYSLNRFYLIVTSLVAFLLPLLQVGYLSSFLYVSHDQEIKIASMEMIAENTAIDLMIYYGISLIKYCYITVAILLLMKFFKGLYRILLLAWTAPKAKMGKVLQIELNDPEIAFSFFHFLFLNPRATEQETIVRHELVHIQQKHSFDVLLFEFLLIINWFNPITWLLKKDIQLLHEYIADEQTTALTLKKHEYALFLIQNSFGQIPNPLSNQLFNQSILKMRINMLNKEKSAGSAKMRLLLTLPLAAAMVCSSSMAFTKDYAALDLYSSKEYKSSGPSQDSLKKVQSKKSSGKMTKAQPKKTGLESKTVEGKPTKKVVKFPPPIVTPDPPAKKIPAPKIETTKFPPPIVKKDATARKKTAPKAATVKFPPPVVKKDEVSSMETPPPPPVEPPSTRKSEE